MYINVYTHILNYICIINMHIYKIEWGFIKNLGFSFESFLLIKIFFCFLNNVIFIRPNNILNSQLGYCFIVWLIKFKSPKNHQFFIKNYFYSFPYHCNISKEDISVQFSSKTKLQKTKNEYKYKIKEIKLKKKKVITLRYRF